MKIKQTFCKECDKVVDDLPVVDGCCPRCDCPNFVSIVKIYETDKFSNMDIYYESCATRKETLGGLADKNAKRFGRNHIEEAEHFRKIQRDQRIDEIFAKKGKKRVKSSGITPFYREGGKKMTESEANKFLAEYKDEVSVKPAKVRKKK